MFANAFQSGFLSIFYSVGSTPLGIWDKNVKNGHIRRVIDEEVKSLVLEISGTNVATTFITCPNRPRASLGVKLPFLVMVVKNMKKYFTFEIQIIDDKDMRRRFRVSNFQSTTKVRPFCTTMPIGLSTGWNQIQFNLADFTRRAYGTVYIETIRVQVHANVRIRRIYFSDRLYSEEELPNEYKLFMPLQKGKAKSVEKVKTKEKEKEQKISVTKELGPEEVETVPSAVPAGAPPTPIEPSEFIEEEHEIIADYEDAMPEEEQKPAAEMEPDVEGGIEAPPPPSVVTEAGEKPDDLEAIEAQEAEAGENAEEAEGAVDEAAHTSTSEVHVEAEEAAEAAEEGDFDDD